MSPTEIALLCLVVSLVSVVLTVIFLRWLERQDALARLAVVEANIAGERAARLAGCRSYAADGPVRDGQVVVLSEDGKSVRAHRGEADYREALVGVVVKVDEDAKEGGKVV